MKILQALAQATIDTARTLSAHDLPALADAALRCLDQRGLSSKKTLFFRHLRHALVKEKAVLPLTLVTPSGTSGKHAESIASFVHLALGKPVALQESADPTLLGGALLAYRDERYDASLRGYLASLDRHLSSPPSHDAE